MTNIEQLEKKIAELRKVSKIESNLIENIGDFKPNVFESKKDIYIVSFRIETKEQFKIIHDYLKPTRQTTKLTFSSRDDIEYNSPYIINIENEPTYKKHVKIQWVCNNYDVWVELPAELLKEFIQDSERKIYDCEYHYFTGWSYNKLYNTKIHCYRFKDGSRDQINYYGGDIRTVNTILIEQIINSLTNL